MYVHPEACTQMFIAALFLFTKSWKQPNCPLMVEWIKKQKTMQYPYNGLLHEQNKTHTDIHNYIKESQRHYAG